jgi:bacillithiol system protein YtxJ
MPDNVRPLLSVEDWQHAFEASSGKPLLVFKHSTRCSISAGAHEEFTHFMEDIHNPAFDTALVRVVEERPVSNAIAETLDLKHASPQAIFIKNGKVAWHTSHWNITYAFLEEHLAEHCEK